MARILLIDDDEELTAELGEALERTGHLVTRLERAAHAPQLLTERDFDVVLLDNRMTGMTGLEFLEALRARDLGIPVILMTGCADADTAIQAVQRGAFNYLEKPDDYDALFRELTPLLEDALRI